MKNDYLRLCTAQQYSVCSVELLEDRRARHVDLPEPLLHLPVDGDVRRDRLCRVGVEPDDGAAGLIEILVDPGADRCLDSRALAGLLLCRRCVDRHLEDVRLDLLPGLSLCRAARGDDLLLRYAVLIHDAQAFSALEEGGDISKVDAFDRPIWNATQIVE